MHGIVGIPALADGVFGFRLGAGVVGLLSAVDRVGGAGIEHFPCISGESVIVVAAEVGHAVLLGAAVIEQGKPQQSAGWLVDAHDIRYGELVCIGKAPGREQRDQPLHVLSLGGGHPQQCPGARLGRVPAQQDQRLGDDREGLQGIGSVRRDARLVQAVQRVQTVRAGGGIACLQCRQLLTVEGFRVNGFHVAHVQPAVGGARCDRQSRHQHQHGKQDTYPGRGFPYGFHAFHRGFLLTRSVSRSCPCLPALSGCRSDCQADCRQLSHCRCPSGYPD